MVDRMWARCTPWVGAYDCSSRGVCWKRNEVRAEMSSGWWIRRRWVGWGWYGLRGESD